MADSYALEMDDLHRRWLPKEILDDIGFADGDAAAPPPAAIEGLAVHLAGILGSGARKVTSPPPTAATGAAPASYHNQLHRVPVCGQVLVAYGGEAGWPFPPYSSPAQWQVAAGLVNGGGGGAVDHRRRLGSPPPKMRCGGGGTGVFLPRTYVYHAKEAAAAAAATKPSSRDGKASKDLLVEEEQQQQQPGQGEEEEASPAAKLEQRCPPMTGTASSEVRRVRQNAAAALPQEWTY